MYKKSKLWLAIVAGLLTAMGIGFLSIATAQNSSSTRDAKGSCGEECPECKKNKGTGSCTRPKHHEGDMLDHICQHEHSWPRRTF